MDIKREKGSIDELTTIAIGTFLAWLICTIIGIIWKYTIGY